MIEDTFKIKDWNICILYYCTCDDTDYIVETLMGINCPIQYINEAIDNIDSCNLNIGLTYSNLNLKSSVIVISKTSNFGQTINTISHEYYHLICHLSRFYEDLDEEELARIVGELNMKSYNFLQKSDLKVGSE